MRHRFYIRVLALLLLTACRPALTPDTAVTATVPSALPLATATATTTAGPTTTALPVRPTATSPAVPSATPAVESTATPSPVPTAGRMANADVLYVRAVQAADGSWTFYVTVQHPDTGWEDYADGWDVMTPDGTVITPDPESSFTRLLLHPHVDEQPFTRSQSGILIPEGVTQVRVRAHDLVDGFGGREVVVDLTIPSGPDFKVERR